MAMGVYDSNAAVTNPNTATTIPVYKPNEYTDMLNTIKNQIVKFNNPESKGVAITQGNYNCTYNLSLDDTNNQDIRITLTLEITYKDDDLVDLTFSTENSISYYYNKDTEGDYSSQTSRSAYNNAYMNITTLFMDVTERIIYALVCMEHANTTINGETLKQYMNITSSSVSIDFRS